MGSQALRQVVILLIVVCHGLSAYAILPSKGDCVPVEWAANWNDSADISNTYAFEKPGEIIEGVVVRDIIQLAGLAWNARSWREITGLFCVSYGPLMNGLVGDDNIRRSCDPILSSLKQNEDSSIYDDCIRVSYISGASNASDDPLNLYYSSNDDINNIQTVPNLSPTAFELLDWVGPSPFSFDIYGACSALRILLSTPVADILDKVQDITVHPLAVVLKSDIFRRICRESDPTDDEILALAIVNSISDRPLCQFVSTIPTLEASKDMATAIINNAEDMFTDTFACQKLLTAWYNNIRDEYFHDIFNVTTGKTLRLTRDREQLCTDISEAFAPDSRYTPTEYSLPQGASLDELRTPGEFLPGFYFRDVLNIAGAFLRAETLGDGMILLCDVFGEFISDLNPEYNIPTIGTMCASLRGGQFSDLDDACIDILSDATLSSYQDYNYQYSHNFSESHSQLQDNYQTVPEPVPDPSFSLSGVNIYYLAANVMELYMRLFQPTRISPEDTCADLDNYFRSDNNLRSLTRHAAVVALEAVIPIAHKICENYREIYDYYRTRDCCGTFPAVERNVQSFILAHFGFASRAELCRSIAEGIDKKSGRATDDAVTRFQEEALKFLTNERRCRALELPFRRFFNETGSGSDSDEVFPKYTGYDSAEEACKELRQFFASKTCDVCELPPEVGSCDGALDRWYANEGHCETFTYGGCEGNGNNFMTEDDCEKRCGGPTGGAILGSHPYMLIVIVQVVLATVVFVQ